MLTCTTSDEEIKHLARLIHGIKVAMLTTVCEDGSLHSRPMATLETDFGGALWFFTSVDSPKVGEMQQERQVNVSYTDHSEERYVSISGRAGLVVDRVKINELWKPCYEVWFHKGLDDPQLALLRVDAERAEYWDCRSSTMMRLDGFAKSPELQASP